MDECSPAMQKLCSSQDSHLGQIQDFVKNVSILWTLQVVQDAGDPGNMLPPPPPPPKKKEKKGNVKSETQVFKGYVLAVFMLATCIKVNPD